MTDVPNDVGVRGTEMTNASKPPEQELESDRIAPNQRGISSVLVLAMGTFAVGTDAFILAAFLPSMAEGLHVSSSVAGLSMTIFTLTYAFFAPVIATLTARMSRRSLLVIALIVLALANVISATAPNFPILMASRVLAAVGAAAFTPTAGAASAALVRTELRGRALAVVIGGLTIATALGVPIGNLANLWLGWRAALVLVSIVSLVAAVSLFVSLPKLPGSPPVELRRRLAALRYPGVLTILPITILGMAACYTPYAYSVLVLHALGVAPKAMVIMLFLYGLGAVIGNLFSGFATDGWGPIRTLTTTYVVMFASLSALGVMAISGSIQVLVCLLVFLWGASSFAQTAAQQHRLIAVAPTHIPLVISLNSSAIYLGIGLGTLLGGIALPMGIAVILGLGGGLAVFTLLILRITNMLDYSVVTD
ncbi:MAG: MFS transporter [Porticoccaceae bacterium]